MGFMKDHMVGTGMNYESIGTGANFDIIVKNIGGVRGNRTTTIKVKGIAHLDEICLSQGGPEVNIVNGVRVGMTPHNSSKNVVWLYHEAYPDFDMVGGDYSPSEYR